MKVDQLAYVAAIVSIALFAGQASAQIFTQAPCADPGGVCKTFDFDDTIPTIRGIAFTIPGPGSAQATFTGSLYCFNNTSSDRTIDLVSQIVGTSTQNPLVSGPGAARHAVILKDTPSATEIAANTFNLAAARVFTYTTGGAKTVYFKIARTLMESGTHCVVYDASFSVVFYRAPSEP